MGAMKGIRYLRGAKRLARIEGPVHILERKVRPVVQAEDRTTDPMAEDSLVARTWRSSTDLSPVKVGLKLDPGQASVPSI